METVTVLDVTLMNEDKGYSFAQFSEEVRGTAGIFRSLQQSYGRCMSKVYKDTPEGTKVNGWYFEKISHYDDTGEPFKQGAWCSFRSFQSHYLS